MSTLFDHPSWMQPFLSWALIMIISAHALCFYPSFSFFFMSAIGILLLIHFEMNLFVAMFCLSLWKQHMICLFCLVSLKWASIAIALLLSMHLIVGGIISSLQFISSYQSIYRWSVAMKVTQPSLHFATADDKATGFGIFELWSTTSPI